VGDAAEQARKLWNENPCGAVENFEHGSLEFFDEVRRSRYEVTDTWMNRLIDFAVARNKKLLEVGHGLGTDLLRFCDEGAEVYGIDITEEHHRLAQLNFDLHGKPCTLKLCNCTDIDFPSVCFDYVYSHGVLHHTDHTVRCLSEIYRVLKPGGQLILGLYYTYSAFHLVTVCLYRGMYHGEMKRLGYRGLLSTVENGADGIRVKPLVKTYRKSQLRAMLSDFSQVKFKVAHFKREHLPRFGRYMPRWFEHVLEPYLGWYVLAFATK
jgi:ubiquinone/menaquinone biosynthesis C-methylase UbiE